MGLLFITKSCYFQAGSSHALWRFRRVRNHPQDKPYNQQRTTFTPAPLKQTLLDTHTASVHPHPRRLSTGTTREVVRTVGIVYM